VSGPKGDARSVPRSMASIEIDDGDTGGRRRGGGGREIGHKRKARELRRTGFRKLREKCSCKKTCIKAVSDRWHLGNSGWRRTDTPGLAKAACRTETPEAEKAAVEQTCQGVAKAACKTDTPEAEKAAVEQTCQG
jgi:hypothetical protein